MIIYRCDVCKQVTADIQVPDSWRKLVLYDEDEDGREKDMLTCTACISSFHAWLTARAELRELPLALPRKTR